MRNKLKAFLLYVSTPEFGKKMFLPFILLTLFEIFIVSGGFLALGVNNSLLLNIVVGILGGVGYCIAFAISYTQVKKLYSSQIEKEGICRKQG